MNELIWRNRLVVLWILQALNFICVLVIPDSLAAIVAEIGEALGPLIAFYFFLTSLMMALSVFLKPAILRWPTMLVGAFYAFVKVQWIAGSLTGEMVVSLFLNEVWGLVAALLIIWFGWKIPRVQQRD